MRSANETRLIAGEKCRMEGLVEKINWKIDFSLKRTNNK